MQKKDGKIRAVMAICYILHERQSRMNPLILFVDAATQIVRLGHHFPMNLERKSLLHITGCILARIQTLQQIMPESGWTKAPVKNKR